MYFIRNVFLVSNLILISAFSLNAQEVDKSLSDDIKNVVDNAINHSKKVIEDMERSIDDVRDSANDKLTKYVKLQNSWMAECKGSKILSASTRQLYTFKGKHFVEKRLFFSDGDCKDMIGEATLTGNFDVKTHEDLYDLSLKYKKMTLLANSSLAIDLFNAVELCGIEEWKLNTSYTISNSKDKECFISHVPKTKYGHLKIEKDKLYFSSYFKDSKDDLELSIDRSLPYTKM